MDYDSDQEQTSLNSIVHIKANEAFPKKTLQTEGSGLTIPFPTLFGEAVEFLGRATEGIIALSNYRLFVQAGKKCYNIPLGLIETIECREIFFLYIHCKDARTLRFTFSTNEHCLEWYKRLTVAALPPKKIEDIFAFAFFAWSSEESKDELHAALGNSLAKVNFSNEVERMGFDLRYAWRVSKINHDYSFCPTYPRDLLVPFCVRDDDLEQVAEFRSSRRVPTIVWRHQKYGSIIARSSQPMVGWFGCRKMQDENLIRAIAAACACDCGTPNSYSSCVSSSSSISSTSHGDVTPQQDLALQEEKERHSLQKVLIIDARSYAAAVANRAKGGGCECSEYYPYCEIQFMSLANIHSIRRSFQSVRHLCATDLEQPNWLSILEGTKWLQHLSGLLKSALAVVNAVDRDKRPVLVHCSDGWDRTPQIVALAELMLDPYYRTIEGFEVLVEKEWLEFGHKFGDRCGHGVQADDTNERCPVFLQWLDCVHQVLKKYPCSFEFNENFLVKLTQHTYSSLFGTFICNSSQERQFNRVGERTYSAWSFFRSQLPRFRNILYSQKNKVLRPSCQVRDLVFWSAVYLQGSESNDESVLATSSESLNTAGCSMTSSSINEKIEKDLGGISQLQKTRSCDDLVAAVEHPIGRHRRNSDPSILDGIRGLILDSSAIPFNCNKCKEEDMKCCECAEHHGLVADARKDGSDSSDSKEIAYGSKETLSCDCSDEDEDEDEDEEKTCAYMPEYNELSSDLHKANLSACESSTDTLVGDLAGEFKSEGVGGSSTSTSSRTNNTIMNISQNGSADCDKNDIVSKEIIPSSILGLKLDSFPERLKRCDESNGLEHWASVSTSTSDLSTPRVQKLSCCSQYFNGQVLSEFGNYANMPVLPHGLLNFAKCPMCSNGNRLLEVKLEALKNLVSQAGSRLQNSVAHTPLHSRTPSSGFPATPNDDRLSDCASGTVNGCGPRGSTGIAQSSWKKFDIDGLTLDQDEVQQRLREIITEQQGKMKALQHALCVTQLLLSQQICNRCNALLQPNAENSDETMSLADSSGSGEHQSLGQESNGTSDQSWEQVEENETHPTLWVPDHAVSRCTNCDTQFWLGRRKHHCRNCGKIFCAHCSSQEVPIPNEQLYDPVRVCLMCYDQLRCKQISLWDSQRIHKALMAAAASN